MSAQPRRSRRLKDDPKEPLLSAREFAARSRALAADLLMAISTYEEAHAEGGWPPGGSGVHVGGGDPSDATLAAVTGDYQHDRRNDCRTAVKWLSEAETAVAKESAALRGEQVAQPKKVDPKATVTQADFDRARARRGFTSVRAEKDHHEREEKMRRG